MFLDPKLLLEEFPNNVIGYAIVGFFIGLTTAFILWYRSARRIQALQDENANLSKGDINVRGGQTDVEVTEESIAAQTDHSEVTETERDIEPGTETSVIAATGAGVAAAATMLTRDEEDDAEFQINTTEAPEPLPEPQLENDFRLTTAFDEEPPDADDLTLLEGIDENRAAELREAGIYKFSQLENLDEEERRKFGFKFGWPDINWGSWGATAAGVGGAAILNRSQATEETQQVVVEEDDFQLATTYDEEPEDVDDLTEIAGIDYDKAMEMRRAGIYKFSQLEELDEEQREKLSRKFNWFGWGGLAGLGALGAGMISEGEQEDEADTYTAPAVEDDENNFQLKTTYDEEPADADDLTQLEGIDSDRAEELRQAGIYKISQLEELDDDEREKLGRKFNFPDISWGKWGTLGALGAGALGAGLLKEGEDQEEKSSGISEPGEADDLTQIDAIDTEKAEKLQYPEIAWGDGFGDSEKSGEEIDLNLETAFNDIPDDADDLTILEGIDAEKAAALHAAGIYKFSQLEDLDEEQRDELGKKFNWPDIEWGKWGAIGALGTVAGATLLGGDDDHKNVPETLTVPEGVDVALSNETQKIQLPDNGNVTPDWTWGYTFKEAPFEPDDLTQLEGITEEDAARLNSEGVYTIKQLEELPEDKREEVKSRFGWGDINWAKWGGTTAAGAAVTAGVAGIASDNDEIETEEATLPSEVAGRSDVENDWTWGYKFKEKPEDADDLTQMEGVSAEDAEELNRQGVYTFQQLESLPEEKQEEVKAKFGWGSIDWGKWGTLATVGSAATAGAVLISGDETEDEAETSNESVESTAASSEVSNVWEVESNNISTQSSAIDNSGRYGELALSNEDFADSIAEEFQGETVEVHRRYGIVYASQPDQIDDLTNVRGIGLATEKQLNSNGIYRFKQIANWNAGAIEGISTDLDLGTRIRDDEWVSQARAFVGDESDLANAHASDLTDYNALISEKYSGQNVEFKPGLGVLYTEPPSQPDDLTEINGIGPSLQAKLNDYGVYMFSQLADWNENNVATFNDRLMFSGRIERDEWIPQAQKFATREVEESNFIDDPSDIPLPDIATYDGSVANFAGQDVDVDQEVGVIYKSRPEQGDDLKRIWGIGHRIEKELNDNGVYRFAQIAHWNDYNVRQFNDRLGLKGRIERDQWISQAQSLAEENNELQDKYRSLIDSEFSGEAVTIKPGFGVVYSPAPSEIDDLTEINGIGPVTESQLNDLGIYRFKQIASFDNEAVEAVEEAIDGPGRVTRNQWVVQAKDFLTADIPGSEDEPGRPENMSYLETLGSFDGENVDIDENFGIVYTGRPSEQDDLKRIRGVGKYLEKELNNRGVYRFKQIANWNPYNIWAFGKDLAFPGRVTRENWVGQSKELAELEDYRVEAEKLVKTEFDGKGVKVDPELGVVYRKKPDSVDDLTQLAGIDEDTAARLNSDGIYTIDQVKSLKGPQKKSFASRFGLGDIDWAKWSGISAVGAAGASALASVKDVGSDMVETVTEKATEVVESVAELGQPEDEIKGIFGTGDEADDSEKRRVAFIMDVSRSLTPAQLRLSKSELSAAITSLPEGSLYQVIFFSGPTWFAHQRMTEGGARGEDVIITDGDEQIQWKSGFGGFEYEQGNDNLPGAAWLEANPANIQATLEDIEAVGKSYGTTWHLPLTMAMNLEPVPRNIYFLTDGETARQDQVAQEMIDMANARGGITKINTIALMVPGASVPLNRMAQGTGGEYALVIAGGKVLQDGELIEYLAEKDISLDD